MSVAVSFLFFFPRSLMSKPYNFYTWHTPNTAGRQLLHLIKYSNQFGLPFRVQTRVRSSRTTFFPFRSVEIISSSSRSTNGREANFLHVHRSRGYCRVFTETQRSNCSLDRLPISSVFGCIRFRESRSVPRNSLVDRKRAIPSVFEANSGSRYAATVHQWLYIWHIKRTVNVYA